jgi:hypothetical protein
MGQLLNQLLQDVFFTVQLILHAREQMAASDTALHCDMVSISIHSNVFIFLLNDTGSIADCRMINAWRIGEDVEGNWCSLRGGTVCLESWGKPWKPIRPFGIMVLVQKLAFPQLVKKFCGTWGFITVFTTAHHVPVSLTRSIQSMPSHLCFF